MNIDRPDGQTCPQLERSSASEPINLGMERNLTLGVRPTRHLPDNIRPICVLRDSNRLMARHRTDQGGLLRWKGSLGPLSLSLAPAFAVWFELATGFFEGVRRIDIQLCGAGA